MLHDRVQPLIVKHGLAGQPRMPAPETPTPQVARPEPVQAALF